MTHPKRKRQTTPPSYAAPTQASKAKRVRFSLPLQQDHQPTEVSNEQAAEELTQASVKEEKGEDGANDERVILQPKDKEGGNEGPISERAPAESTTGGIIDRPAVEPDLNDVRVDAAAFDRCPLGSDPSSDGDSETDSVDKDDSLDGDTLDEDTLDEDSLDEDSLDEDSLDEDSQNEDPLDDSSDGSSSSDSSPSSHPPHHNPTTPNTFTAQTLTSQNIPPGTHLSHCTIISCNIATATLTDCRLTSCNARRCTAEDCTMTSCNLVDCWIGGCAVVCSNVRGGSVEDGCSFTMSNVGI